MQEKTEPKAEETRIMHRIDRRRIEKNEEERKARMDKRMKLNIEEEEERYGNVRKRKQRRVNKRERKNKEETKARKDKRMKLNIKEEKRGTGMKEKKTNKENE